MNLIIQRPSIQTRPIRTPRNRRHRAAHFKSRNSLLPPIIPSLPYMHEPIIRRAPKELRPSASRHRSVNRVDNPLMRMEFSNSFTR